MRWKSNSFLPDRFLAREEGLVGWLYHHLDLALMKFPWNFNFKKMYNGQEA